MSDNLVCYILEIYGLPSLWAPKFFFSQTHKIDISFLDRTFRTHIKSKHLNNSKIKLAWGELGWKVTLTFILESLVKIRLEFISGNPLILTLRFLFC